MAPPHEWTAFEKHTLRCLMCRGIHITGFPEPDDVAFGRGSAARGKKRILKLDANKNAILDVTTALNKAVNSGDFSKDISRKDVAAMIDTIMKQKGAYAVMERQKVGRMTRAMKRTMARGITFTGDLREWKSGRKDAEERLRLQQEQRDLEREQGIIQSMEIDTSGVAIGWDNPATIVEAQASLAIDDSWDAREAVVFTAPIGSEEVDDEWGGNIGAEILPPHIDDQWSAFGSSTTKERIPTQSQTIDDDWGGLEDLKMAATDPSPTTRVDDDWEDNQGAPVRETSTSQAMNDAWVELGDMTSTKAAPAQTTETESDQWSTGKAPGIGNNDIAIDDEREAAPTTQATRISTPIEDTQPHPPSVRARNKMAIPDEPRGTSISGDFCAREITASKGFDEWSTTPTTPENAKLDIADIHWDIPLPSTEKITPKATPILESSDWDAPQTSTDHSPLDRSSSPTTEALPDIEMPLRNTFVARKERSSAPSPSPAPDIYTSGSLDSILAGHDVDSANLGFNNGTCITDATVAGSTMYSIPPPAQDSLWGCSDPIRMDHSLSAARPENRGGPLDSVLDLGCDEKRPSDQNTAQASPCLANDSIVPSEKRKSSISGPEINPERLAMLANTQEPEDVEMEQPEKRRVRGKPKPENSNYMPLTFNRLEKIHGSRADTVTEEMPRGTKQMDD